MERFKLCYCMSYIREGVNMKRKIIGIFVCMLLVATILPITGTVIAGDEENPEIEDKENGDDLFGTLIEYPNRLRTKIALLLLDLKSFDFMDIDSAWFFEDENESDYLHIAVKLKDLEFINQRAIYSVHWIFNGVNYVVGSHATRYGENISYFVGVDRSRGLHEVGGNYDIENNIVTFKFNKEFIGNPQPGDVLTNTWAWTALRFTNELITLFFSSGELVKDAAPFIENYDDYGQDYIIKY